MKNYKCLWIVVMGIALFLAACGNNEATPTAIAQAVTETVPAAADTAIPTAAPTESAVPSNTPSPTETPSPEPTATVTASATPTTVPTDTATPKPTATATRQPTVAAVQSTATPTTAVPVAVPVAPPPAPAPAGPNLLANPGFEAGDAGWVQVRGIQDVGGKPQFVHSGEYSAYMYGQQPVTNIAPVTTYRAGAWVKLWSSTGEDRTISENSGDVKAVICIDTDGHEDGGSPPAVCASARPLDTWQYISVDAVAINDRMKVIMYMTIYGPNLPIHNEVYWDDVELGLAPVAATATPLPTAPPSRPAPVAFNAASLRDNMNFVRSQIEQMGGVLDRMYNGESGKCTEYQGYYDNLIFSATYDGIPTEWQTIYNDYIFAVENTIATNEGLNSLCDHGGGNVTQQNYGTGRQGINISLERLIPAIDAANALLGG